MQTTTCDANCKLRDMKTQFEIEAPVDIQNCHFVTLSIDNGTLKAVSTSKSGQETTIGEWNISYGVHVEAMTSELKNGMLFIRLPKGDNVEPRALQYTESVRLTPVS